VAQKQKTVHPDDIDNIDLAPPVSARQWRALRELRERGYTGPAPVSGPQAEQILRQWRRSAPGVQLQLDTISQTS
jgi:hypothetical protein